MAFPLTIAGMVLAIILYALARRGVRIDDHPLCRFCRFDLSGADPARCPECGALSRGLFVFGNRRRSPWLGPISALAFFACLSLAVVIGPWAPMKTRPMSALLVQVEIEGWTPGRPAYDEIVLRIGDPSVSTAQLDRIASRLRAASAGSALRDQTSHEHLTALLAGGRLSRQAADQTVAWALARHADPNGPWTEALGDLLAFARGRGLVADADWRGYVGRFVVFHAAASVPTPIASNRDLRLVIEWNSRGGTSPPEIHSDLAGTFRTDEEPALGDPLSGGPLYNAAVLHLALPPGEGRSVLQGRFNLFPDLNAIGGRGGGFGGFGGFGGSWPSGRINILGPDSLVPDATNDTPVSIPYIRSAEPAAMWRGARVREELIARVCRGRLPKTNPAAPDGRIYILPVGDAVHLDLTVLARGPAGERSLQSGFVELHSSGCGYLLSQRYGGELKGEISGVGGIAVPWFANTPLTADERLILRIDDARPFKGAESYAFDPFEIDLTDAP